MWGTSIYLGLVKPVIETSDKYPELLFMPALLLLLNYIAGKVRIRGKFEIPNMFLGIIGPYGNFFKSTCCELAQTYFINMGLAAKYHSSLRNAEGKTIIISAGSPEGFGLRMQSLNAKNGVLYFDELGKFIGKANIENSTFTEDLCTMYDSREFQNVIKSTKNSYAFNAGSYCFSWMWCTTDRKFPSLWQKLANDSSGLNDRMFFLLTPQVEKKTGLYTTPDTWSGMAKTGTN